MPIREKVCIRLGLSIFTGQRHGTHTQDTHTQGTHTGYRGTLTFWLPMTPPLRLSPHPHCQHHRHQTQMQPPPLFLQLPFPAPANGRRPHPASSPPQNRAAALHMHPPAAAPSLSPHLPSPCCPPPWTSCSPPHSYPPSPLTSPFPWPASRPQPLRRQQRPLPLARAAGACLRNTAQHSRADIKTDVGKVATNSEHSNQQQLGQEPGQR